MVRVEAPLPATRPASLTSVHLQRILQYTLRLLAYIRARSFRTPVLRLLGVVSILSAIRRVVALVDLSTLFYRSYLPALNPLNLFTRKPDVKGKGRAVDGIRRPRPWRLDDLLRLSRTALDIGATVADCTFLLARLSLLPLSKRSTRRADRIADYTTLLSSLIGLAQVAHSRSQVWDEGRTVRKGAIALEQRLEEFEFWAKGEGETSLDEEKAEKEREERRLRERVRSERKKLKRLREELNELWWERLRLAAEGVFASESSSVRALCLLADLSVHSLGCARVEYIWQ